nr:G-type lectin S-receptor-like serine/threonine-protein kinase At4g27290 [Ipomoea batatas]
MKEALELIIPISQAILQIRASATQNNENREKRSYSAAAAPSWSIKMRANGNSPEHQQTGRREEGLHCSSFLEDNWGTQANTETEIKKRVKRAATKAACSIQKQKSFTEISFACDTISSTQFLKDGNTIVSSGGIFEMGFFSPANSQNRYVGIWYKQIPYCTVVWVANRDTPITNTSSVVLKITNPAGWLALVDGNDNANIWHTSASRLVPNPVAKLLDSGNLVVTDANDDNPENFLWQSFDHPSDTHLPGMKLGRNFITGLDTTISAWKSENNPGMGEYKLSLDPAGYPQLILRKGRKEVHRSGPWNGLGWGGSRGIEKTGYIVRLSVVMNSNEVSTNFKVNNTSTLVRVVLTNSGSLEAYIWADGTGEWTRLLKVPSDDCDEYGYCGAYGSCNYDNYPFCRCLDKFLPRDLAAWDRADFSGGCVRRTPLSCGNGSSSDGFVKYSGIKLPDTKFSTFYSSLNLQECEQVCFNNCSCIAYSSLDISNGEHGCLLWFSDLIDISVVPSDGQDQDLYIRMASSDLDHTSSSKGKKSKRLKLISSSVLAGILVLSLIMTLIVILYKRKRKEIHLKWEEDQTLSEVSTIRRATITRATDNFSLNNKIGEGGYGPVYKGVLDDGKEIAVKRLSKTSLQGLGEFKNEVNSIARLQHRNLVKLLGWIAQPNTLLAFGGNDVK